MKRLLKVFFISILAFTFILPLSTSVLAASDAPVLGYTLEEGGYTSNWVGSQITTANWSGTYGAWVATDGQWNGCVQWTGSSKENVQKVKLDSEPGVLTFPDGNTYSCKIYPAQTQTPIGKGGVFFSLDLLYTPPSLTDEEGFNSNFPGVVLTNKSGNGDTNLLCITNQGEVYESRYNMGSSFNQLVEGWNTLLFYILPYENDEGVVCNKVYFAINNSANVIPHTLGITQEDLDNNYHKYDFNCGGKYFSELSGFFLQAFQPDEKSKVDNISIRNVVVRNLVSTSGTTLPSPNENLYKLTYDGYGMSAYVPAVGGNLTISTACDIISGETSYVHSWKNASSGKTYNVGDIVYVSENMILQADPNAGHVYDNACDTTCNACGQTRTVPDHVYDYVCDATCNECGALREVNNHLFDNACDTACNVCGQTRVVPDHVYDNACDTTCNVCGVVRVVGGHVHSNNCDTTCNECGQVREVPDHIYDNDCDTACNECGATRTVPDHIYKNACDATCDECNAMRIVPDHVYDGICDTACNECGIVREAPDHTYDDASDTACNECGKEREVCSHTYDNLCDTSCNKCGEIRTVPDHYYSNDCDTTCNFCQEVREVAGHVYSNACDVSCNKCYEEREVGEHIYDNVCDPSCNICEKERAVAGHQYDNDCDRICDKCETERDVPAHAYDNPCDAYCNECGFEREVSAHVDENKDQSCDVCRVYVPKKGLSTGAVVGISVGATVAVSGGGFVLLWFVLKKKRI